MAGLHDQRVAFVEGDRIVVVAAEEQIDAFDAAHEFAVISNVVVGERHDHVGARCLEPRDRGLSGGDRRRDGDGRPGRGQHVGLGREQPEKTDLVAGDLDHVQIDRADRRLAIAAAHVGTEPRECGCTDALRGDLGAEIEIVIAEHRDVGAEQIVQLDHLRTLGEPGQHRGRDQIGAEGGDAVRGRRPLLVQQGRELGEAAPALPGRDLVDVVGVQDRDRHRLGERGGSEQQRRQGDHRPALSE
jgi:hypothetical protein